VELPGAMIWHVPSPNGEIVKTMGGGDAGNWFASSAVAVIKMNLFITLNVA